MSFSVKRLIAVQNLISAKAEAGEMPFDADEVAVMSWALGIATAEAERRESGQRAPFTLTNEQLHQANDFMLAQYLHANPGALPSRTSVLELLTWSHARMLRDAKKTEGS